MPWSERSNAIKEFLRWLDAKGKRSPPTVADCLRHLKLEITDLGITDRTARSYISTLGRLHFISFEGARVKITQEAREWLQRKA